MGSACFAVAFEWRGTLEALLGTIKTSFDDVMPRHYRGCRVFIGQSLDAAVALIRTREALNLCIGLQLLAKYSEPVFFCFRSARSMVLVELTLFDRCCVRSKYSGFF